MNSKGPSMIMRMLVLGFALGIVTPAMVSATPAPRKGAKFPDGYLKYRKANPKKFQKSRGGWVKKSERARANRKRWMKNTVAPMQAAGAAPLRARAKIISHFFAQIGMESNISD